MALMHAGRTPKTNLPLRLSTPLARKLVGGLLTIVFAVVLTPVGEVMRGSGSAQAAGPRPLFQLPVSCGETWELSTYVGHDYFDIDMRPISGTKWGRPILASYGGTVAASGIDGTLGDRTPENPNGPMGTDGGYYVRIDHGNGWQTRYLHMLEPPMVGVGQRVEIGQQLGKVGSTGRSSGPHLHYEQLRDWAKTESYFDGVPSGITHDHSDYSVTRTSRNCGSRPAAPAVMRDDSDGTMTIWKWESTGSAFVLDSSRYESGPWSIDQVGDRFAAGDVNGDGYDDVVAAYQNAEGKLDFHVWSKGRTYDGKWYTSSGLFGLDPVAGRLVIGAW